MHPISLGLMTKFFMHYITKKNQKVLDVGGLDLNGSYRGMVQEFGHQYIALDIRKGPGVDIAVKDPYKWKEVKDASFDVVISGSTIENIEYPEKTMLEIERVLKPGGLCCIITPSVKLENRNEAEVIPYDDLVKLITDAKLVFIKGDTSTEGIFKDVIVIGKKNEIKSGQRPKKKRQLY